ncbi:amidase [Biformimicrobium ophioploci]|uniref:Amidase n=1 Tax=Biformimicrobium ophioploci TaxID=3036711 RepID=A0ABQ6LW97_9GAMM|nr:amidase [Microbulbifer sp. NKW57]GMG86292.1 amidase [Microbulbifer sp. NKW57]
MEADSKSSRDVQSLLLADATTLAGMLAREEISSVELTTVCLQAIEHRNPQLNCYLHIDAGGAIAAAQASDARRAAGVPLSIFDGLTFAVKDNIDVAGMPTSNGLGYGAHAPRADRDAAVVAELRAAGMIPLGKLNMHEIALGATNDNYHWGRCENPLREGYTPGGSSGGSGAAVAAGLCALALGTDTMGSVRIPASYCGVAALKPGRGQWSLDGVTRLSHVLDSVGLLARSGRDLQALWKLPPVSHLPRAEEQAVLSLQTMRFAAMTLDSASDLDQEILTAFAQATSALAGQTASLEARDCIGMDFSGVRRAGLLMCEAEANVTFADELAQGQLFSLQLRKMLRWGAEQPAPALVRAQDTVQAAGEWLAQKLEGVDFLLTPTTPQAAFPFSEPAPVNQANLTSYVNMAGLAATSVPLGVTADGLPFGLQVIARAGDEQRLLAASVALENFLRATSAHTQDLENH